MKWEKKTIGEICNVISGGTPKRSRSDYWGGNIPWVKISDMLQGEIIKTEETITQKGLTESSAKLLEPGTLLLSIFATVGRTAVIKVQGATNQAIVGLVITSNLVSRNYLRHYLNASAKRLKSLSRGIAQDNINTTILKNFPVLIPPLEEQRRIAKMFDLCSSLKENIENLNSRCSTFNSALLIDRFGEVNPTEYKNNRIINLEKVLENITYGLTVRPKYYEEGLPLISASQIRNGYINFLSAPKISSEDFDKLSHKCKPQKGDILFSKTGSIGHSAIVGETRNFAIAQNVARLTFDKEKVNPIWMLNLLRSDYIQKLCISRSKGNAVKDLQLGEIKKFKIVLPTFNKQCEYSDLITYANALNKKLKERKEILIKLIASIESFAFIES